MSAGGVYPVGAEMVSSSEAHVRVWAPDHPHVTLIIDSRSVSLDAEAGGYHGCQVVARPGSRYGFRFDGDEKVYPDPASRSQPDGPHGLSAIVDLSGYAWHDAAWTGVSLPGQVLYEFHVGTFTHAGTWRDAAEQLPRLRDAGITVLQMMPVAEFDGDFGWGYDGVQWFAPFHGYGAPADLQHFVDTAHGLGLAVTLDVVYHHLGRPATICPASRAGTAAGATPTSGVTPQLDDAHCEGLRELVLANVAYWVREFHVDGFRIDAASKSTMSRPSTSGGADRVARETAAPRSVIVVADTSHSTPADAPRARPAATTWTACSTKTSTTRRGWPSPARTRLIRRTTRHGARVGCRRRARLLFQDSIPVAVGAARRAGARSAAHEFIAFIENHDQVANAAVGQRRWPSRARRRGGDVGPAAARPWTPLLFQGQEWGTRTPFSYFCDHGPDLQAAVFQGRQQFLSQFTRLREAYQGASIDAVGRPAFEAGRLDHAFDALADPTWRMYRDLTTLRREDASLGQHAVRLVGSTMDDHTLLLRFIGRVAQEDRLLVVNWGPISTSPVCRSSRRPPELFEWAVLWSSEDPRYGGWGIAGHHTL